MSDEIEAGRRSEGLKSISPERDSLQSRVLVGVVGALLLLAALETLATGTIFRRQSLNVALAALVISVAFAAIVRILRAATVGGALCGGFVCLTITFWTVWNSDSFLHSGLPPLVMLFVLTFLATRAGRARKANVGLAEKRSGRSASQVIANLSVAALCVAPLGGFGLCRPFDRCFTGNNDTPMDTVVLAMLLAALVEATADTVSSEIGQAFGGEPFMVTTLRRVKPGTDGAVTLMGTAAGIAAGAIVARVGMSALQLGHLKVLAALFAGVCGLFLDSLLGATLERKGLIGNDLVNFSSTLFAVLVVMVLLNAHEIGSFIVHF